MKNLHLACLMLVVSLVFALLAFQILDDQTYAMIARIFFYIFCTSSIFFLASRPRRE